MEEQKEEETLPVMPIKADQEENPSRNNDEMLLKRFEDREKELLAEKIALEKDFSTKRAKFKDLFLHKEGELEKTQRALKDALSRSEHLESALQSVRQELDDLRTATALEVGVKYEEIDREKERYQSELASIQEILKESLAATKQYEEEAALLAEERDRLEAEISQLRNSTDEREGSGGLLSSVAKSLPKTLKKFRDGIDIVGSADDDRPSNNCSSASPDRNVRPRARTVADPAQVSPEGLPRRLSLTGAVTKVFSASQPPPENVSQEDLASRRPEVADSTKEQGGPDEKGSKPRDGRPSKLKELSSTLEAEKASQSDLEMYVGVLNTQKCVLQDDNDRLKIQLEEVCVLLEREKAGHEQLKQTWQAANDQFLESQRLLMKDIRRLTQVLSEEQCCFHSTS